MLKLDEEQKRFIIAHLARGAFASAVAKSFQEEFGIAITRGVVMKYDPRKTAGEKLSKKLKDSFYEQHQKFLDEIEEIPFAHPAVRLTVLEAEAEKAIEAGNSKVVILAVDAARKEMQALYVPPADDDEDEK